jgi:hypothetical protein
MCTRVGPDLCRLPGYLMSSAGAMTNISGDIALHGSAALMVCAEVKNSAAIHAQRSSPMCRILRSRRCHAHQLVVLLTWTGRINSPRQDDSIQSP